MYEQNEIYYIFCYLYVVVFIFVIINKTTQITKKKPNHYFIFFHSIGQDSSARNIHIHVLANIYILINYNSHGFLLFLLLFRYFSFFL